MLNWAADDVLHGCRSERQAVKRWWAVLRLWLQLRYPRWRSQRANLIVTSVSAQATSENAAPTAPT